MSTYAGDMLRVLNPAQRGLLATLYSPAVIRRAAVSTVTRKGSPGDTYRFEVPSSDLQSMHEVGVLPIPDREPYLTCTCINGDKLGGRPSCFHSAAALIAYLAELEA